MQPEFTAVHCDSCVDGYIDGAPCPSCTGSMRVPIRNGQWNDAKGKPTTKSLLMWVCIIVALTYVAIPLVERWCK